MIHDKNSDPLEEFFQHHLANFAEDPPEDALENIRTRIAPPQRVKWRKLAWSGLIFLLLGIALGGSFWANKQSQRIKQLEQKLAASQTDDFELKIIENTASEVTSDATQKSSSPNETLNHGEHKNGSKWTNGKTSFKQYGHKAKLIAERKKRIEVKDKLILKSDSIEVLLARLKTKNDVASTPSPVSLELLDKLEIGRFQYKNKRSPSTRPTIASPFHNMATETYAGWLPVNGAKGLEAGLRWQMGSAIRLIDRRNWSLSFGIEYGEYVPNHSNASYFQWNEQNTFTDINGHRLASSLKVIQTGFGNGISRANFEYVPQGDALDLLAEDELILRQSVRNRMQLLTVPMVLRYNFGNGRLHWNVKAGMGITSVVRYSTQYQTIVESRHRPKRYKTIFNELQAINDGPVRAFVEAYTGCGISWQMNRRFSLMAEPTAVFTMSNIGKSTSNKIRPKALGLQIGLKRQF